MISKDGRVVTMGNYSKYIKERDAAYHIRADLDFTMAGWGNNKCVSEDYHYHSLSLRKWRWQAKSPHITTTTTVTLLPVGSKGVSDHYHNTEHHRLHHHIIRHQNKQNYSSHHHLGHIKMMTAKHASPQHVIILSAVSSQHSNLPIYHSRHHHRIDTSASSPWRRRGQVRWEGNHEEVSVSSHMTLLGRKLAHSTSPSFLPSKHIHTHLHFSLSLSQSLSTPFFSYTKQ